MEHPTPSLERASTSPSGKRRGVLKVILVLVSATVAVLLVTVILLFRNVGDPAPEPGFPIDNRTDSRLFIYVVIGPSGPASDEPEEVLRIEIPPRSTRPSEMECSSAELVARTEKGREVARREDTDECDVSRWVIEPSTLRMVPSTSTS